jgi:hypothetical protein
VWMIVYGNWRSIGYRQNRRRKYIEESGIMV